MIQQFERSHSNPRFAWFLASGLILLTAPIQSVAEQPLSADRPSTATAPDIVQPGRFQIEGGFSFDRQTNGTPNTNTYTIPKLLVRLGVTSNIEFRISADGYIHKELEGKSNIDNGSDLSIEGKMRWFSQSGFLPNSGALLKISFPTGGDEVTSDGVDPTGTLLWNWTLPRDLGLTANLGFASVKQGKNDSQRVFQTLPSIALTIPLKGGLSGYIEYFSTLKDSGASDEHSVDGGFLYLIADNLQLDVSVEGGLNDAATDYSVGAGVTWRHRFAQ